MRWSPVITCWQPFTAFDNSNLFVSTGMTFVAVINKKLNILMITSIQYMRILWPLWKHFPAVSFSQDVIHQSLGLVHTCYYN